MRLSLILTAALTALVLSGCDQLPRIAVLPPKSGDCAVTFYKGDRKLAVATLGRGRRDGPGFAFLVALHLVAALAVAHYVPYTPPPKPPLPPMPPTAQMLCLGMCGC